MRRGEHHALLSFFSGVLFFFAFLQIQTLVQDNAPIDAYVEYMSPLRVYYILRRRLCVACTDKDGFAEPQRCRTSNITGPALFMSHNLLICIKGLLIRLRACVYQKKLVTLRPF